MTGSNLPPGCSVSDIPGNGPYDDPPDICQECGLDVARKLDAMVHSYLATQQQMDAALERFALRQFRCESCWKALASRGIGLCVQCSLPTALALIVGGKCPPCVEYEKVEEPW